MSRPTIRNLLVLPGVFVLVWLGMKYLFPIALPFLLGAAFAFAAEPMVQLGTGRLHLPRWLASAFSVTITLVLLLSLLLLLTSFAVRELGVLAGILPDMSGTARQGLQLLQDFLLGLAGRAPEGVQPILNQTVLELFGSGTALMNQVTSRIPAVATDILAHVSRGALTLGIGILSGYMISPRLPKIKEWFAARLPEQMTGGYLPALKRIKTALLGWLKAQCKLSGVSFLILTVGFLLLRIPYAPIWAALTALVDALPLLGSGAVLLPWALICLLQGDHFLSIGLLVVYAAAMLTRSTLEPRLVGKQLGLDPLLTLITLYAGYRVWGFWGMLLSPMIAVAAGEFTASTR